VEFNEYLMKVANNLKNNYREVSFEITSDGAFLNGANTQKVQLDINGEARIMARSTKVGSVLVQATVGPYSKQVTSSFQRSWPDQVIVEADSVFLTPLPGMNTGVKARLLKASGIITPGITVRFMDSTGLLAKPSVGVFLNTTMADAAGIASTRYWLQDTSYHHDVYLIATLEAPNGEKRGRTRIRIR
jgi:hypothetical protein